MINTPREMLDSMPAGTGEFLTEFGRRVWTETWIAQTLRALYDAEISFRLATYHRTGFTWQLGDGTDGYGDGGSERALEDAIEELSRSARKRYPKADLPVRPR